VVAICRYFDLNTATDDASDLCLPSTVSAVLQDTRGLKQAWSLDNLKSMRLDRTRYVDLYKRKKRMLEKKKTVRGLVTFKHNGVFIFGFVFFSCQAMKRRSWKS